MSKNVCPQSEIEFCKKGPTHTYPLLAGIFLHLRQHPPAEYESGEWIMIGRSFFVDLSHPPHMVDLAWSGIVLLFSSSKESRTGTDLLKMVSKSCQGWYWKFENLWGQDKHVAFMGRKDWCRPGCHSLQCRSRPGCMWCVWKEDTETHIHNISHCDASVTNRDTIILANQNK